MYESLLQRLFGNDYEVFGDEARLTCPAHEKRVGRPDNHPSFYFNLETGLCYCFSCDYRGNYESLWRDLTGTELEDLEDSPLPADVRVQALRSRLDRVSLNSYSVPTLMAEEDLKGFPHPTFDMLKSRGISSVAADLLEIRRMDSAWVVPIRHVINGVLMGIQLKDGYYVRNIPQGIKKGLSLFGLQTSILDPDEPVLVVESPLDVGVCRTHGLQAVATYGANVTNTQLKEIKRFKEVILAFDNDDPGRTVSDRVAHELATSVVPYREIVWPGDMKDPGDAGRAMSELVDSAPSALSRRLKKMSR